jgi:hypothetical protein
MLKEVSTESMTAELETRGFRVVQAGKPKQTKAEWARGKAAEARAEAVSARSQADLLSETSSRGSYGRAAGKGRQITALLRKATSNDNLAADWEAKAQRYEASGE